MKRIAVIGTGNVGLTLGRRFLESGYQVTFGVRDKNDRDAWARVERLGHGAEIGTLGEVIEENPVIVLAVPYEAALDIATRYPTAGKLILDATNPLAGDFSSLTVEPGTSGGEQIAMRASGADVVKIFNTVPFEAMAAPEYANGTAFLAMAGDSAEAKGVAAGIAKRIGFEVIDVGPLSKARITEHMVLIYISLASGGGLGRDFTTGLLHRRAP